MPDRTTSASGFRVFNSSAQTDQGTGEHIRQERIEARAGGGLRHHSRC